jgi:hypothetical protein
MLSIQARIPKFKKSTGALQPVLPLVQDKTDKTVDDKTQQVIIELKARVGQANDKTKYKKTINKFEEGTPQQWIDTLKALDEVWMQNSITTGNDRAATVRALVKGESLTSFETALSDARTTEDGTEEPATADHVTTALGAVTNTVFPHRALETQKLWMNRRMFKPADLTTRQTAAAINRLNNALPLFPTGTENSKFSDVEVVGLLEWSLPPAWRAKFDLDGYVPTLHPKMQLIEACEAIERNLFIETNKSKHNKREKKGKQKNKHEKGGFAHGKSERSKPSMFYCSEHGNNPTHATADCYTL